MEKLDLKYWNNILKHKSPEEIVDWALRVSEGRIVTTSFGTYSAAILNLTSKKDNIIKVIWCDTRYNTNITYEHAQNLIEKLKLNIKIYQPLLDKETIEAMFGLPSIDDPKYNKFKEVIKLEPFRRALKEHQPEVWFTNIRFGQTKHRNSKNILSYSKDGILKVSPFYYWSDDDLEYYLSSNNLPKNESYFDIAKVLSNRECGIHFQ